MGSYLDNLVALLAKAREELHIADLTEADLQRILDESQENVQKSAQKVEQAKLAVEKTTEQLSSIKEARIASEAKAATAASEENDARLVADMTQKMLDDAAMVHSIANKETARTLEKVGVALQETIRTATAHYQKKTKQREEIDIATVRLFATEKAVDYAVARANTTVENRLCDKLLAEKLAEVKTAEMDVVGWMKLIGEVQKEKEEARFDKVMAQLGASLKEAEQRAENSLVAEDEEKKAAAIYIVEQKSAGETDIEALEEKKREKLLEKQAKTEELLFAQADAKTALEASNIASTSATMLAAEAETAINEGKADQEAALKKLEQHLQSVRDDVKQKKAEHHQASEDFSKTKAHIAAIGESIEKFMQQAAQAEAEEQAARKAADTARKLADNAVKVRLSISSESADLLMQAQQVLAESARNAEDTVIKQQQYRAEIEQQHQQALADQAHSETALREAEQALLATQAGWDQEEERLIREIEAGEKSKAAWSQAFDQKIQEYENKLREAGDAAEQLRLAAAEAQKKVALIEQEIETLDTAIYAFEPAKEELIRKTDRLCEEYLAASQERLSQIYALRQTANEEAALYRQTISEATEAIASMENKEAELRAKLEVSRAHVERIIESAKDQLMAADAQVNLRRAEEEASKKALGEVAEYLESINIEIPAMDTDTQTLLETAIREAAPAADMAEAEFDGTAMAGQEIEAEQPDAATAAEIEDGETATDMAAAETAAAIEPQAGPELEAEQPDAATVAEIAGGKPAADMAAAETAAAIEPQAEPELEQPDAAAAAEIAGGEPAPDMAAADTAAAIEPQAEQEPEAEQPDAAAAVEIAGGEPAPDMAAADTAAAAQAGAKQPEHDLYEEAVQAQLTIELEATRLLEELAALSEADGATENNSPTENMLSETHAEPQAIDHDGLQKAEAERQLIAEEAKEAKPERQLTAEDVEEAEIMAGLSGSIPRIDKDEAAEFTAWLNLIDGDIIKKMMQDEQPPHKMPAPEVNLDDWMANLEKTMNEEEAIAKQMMEQKMTEERKRAVAAGEGDYQLPEDGNGDTNPAPAKKVKKGFRFF
ncbi:MAG: hypothetical protein GX572_04950 [Clostridia bacterium]|nr:hypothetical protein [Clostridia bacterium]